MQTTMNRRFYQTTRRPDFRRVRIVETHPCPFCNGTGVWIPRHGQAADDVFCCRACHGTGETRVREMGAPCRH